LSDEQVVALVNTIAKPADPFTGLGDLALVCLLLEVGLRLSEGLWRTFADIALAQGFGQVIGEGDEGRWVPLGDRARRVLHRYPLPWQAISGAGEGVFITTLALPLKEWQARICHWAKQAGITGVGMSPHSLRFPFVGRWLKSGGDSLA
jgi:integrase/recombinase XerD